MAYGEIYRLKAESYKWKDEIIIDILKVDYAGEITNKYIGAGGITLSKEDGGKICGTTLSFSIQSDSNFEYLNFFEADERTYQVKLYKNSSLIWQGYLISDEYREEFKDPPYDVQLLATDGLGLLKNYDYTIETTSGNKISRLHVLRKILDLIGFGIGYNVAYDVYISPESGGKTLFQDTYFQDDYFDGWTAYDVLEQILPPDATITQHNNTWLIRRNEQDSETTHKLYTRIPDIPEFMGEIYFEYSTGAGETVLDLAPLGSGDVYPIGTAELSMEHAWKKMTVHSDLVKRTSFLKNYNFDDDLNNWTESSTGFSNAYVIGGVTCLGLDGNGGTLGDKVYQYVTNWENEDNFALELKYGLRASKRNVTNGLHYAIDGEVNFRVSIDAGATTYYLDKDEGWTTGATYITESITSNPQGIDWYDLKIYADSPPASGLMCFEVFRFCTSLINVSAILFTVTDVVMKTYAGDDYNDSLQYEIDIRDNGTETGEFTIIPCDVPDIANFDNVFYNAQSDSLNARITGFDDGSITGASYTNLMLNSMYWLHGVPRQLLTGDFRGDNLSLNSIIQADATDDRKYFVRSGEWDLIYDKLSLNLLEIPGSSTGSSWVIPATDYGTVGSWESGGADERRNNSTSYVRPIPTSTSGGTSGTSASRKFFHGIATWTDLSFDDSTMVLTCTTGLKTYWVLGQDWGTSITGEAITCDLNDYYETPTANTIYYFYFDQPDGVLKADVSVWDLNWDVPVATAYYNGTGFAVAYECHNHLRDIDWHYWAHTSVGARYKTGLNKTYPDAANDALLQIETGSILDEDIERTIGQTTGIRGWYQVSAGVYTWMDYNLPYLGTSGDPYWLDTDDYTLKSVDNAKFVCYWLYATNDISRPIYAIPTQAADPHNTLALARSETQPALSGLGLNPEWKLIYKFIYKGDGQFQESTDYRTSSPLPSGGTASVAAAGVTFVPYGNVTGTNVQIAIQILEDRIDEKAGIFTDLNDAPTGYTGASGFLVAVNSDGTGLEFIESASVTGSYQPLDADLSAIAELTGTGYLNRTGSETWELSEVSSDVTKAYVIAMSISLG